MNDLAGIRLLHLHTSQAGPIDAALKKLFVERDFELIDGPFAYYLDNEYRDYFKSIGISVAENPRLYTSIHYVIGTGKTEPVTCEIQVRTLMDEVWGEVDHQINYPNTVDSVACREQIRALAKVTASATRLVDSIFATLDDLG